MNVRSKLKIKSAASALALAMACQPVAVAAQSSQSSPAPTALTSPPAGQFAPPPTVSEASGSAYASAAQKDDRAYADQYSRWAAQNCIDQKNNAVAGAAIGGVLGGVLGSSIREAPVAGAVAGGVIGATAGAAVGAGSANACPPGYVVAAGAPPFYAAVPAYPVVYGPAWYQPWVWVNGQWVYRPDRYWYWTDGAYWRPDWHAGPWRYHYARW